jgi:hypothetical protein
MGDDTIGLKDLVEKAHVQVITMSTEARNQPHDRFLGFGPQSVKGRAGNHRSSAW